MRLVTCDAVGPASRLAERSLLPLPRYGDPGRDRLGVVAPRPGLSCPCPAFQRPTAWRPLVGARGQCYCPRAMGLPEHTISWQKMARKSGAMVVFDRSRSPQGHGGPCRCRRQPRIRPWPLAQHGNSRIVTRRRASPLRDTRFSVRLDVISGSLSDGPVVLFHQLSRIEQLEPKLAALRRFHHLCRTGQFPAVTGSPTQQFRRQILALRTHDAIAQGASIRDIGIMLHGGDRVGAEWPGSGDALKSQARRLIALAREMAGGGYRRLLK